jgi:hypothetical protein
MSAGRSKKNISEFEKMMESYAGLSGISEFENLVESFVISPLKNNPEVVDHVSTPPPESIILTEAVKDNTPEPIQENPINIFADAIGQEQQHVKKEEIQENYNERLSLLEQGFSAVSRRSRDFSGATAGSGETRLKRLDDVDTSNLANDKFLKYNSSTAKFAFVDGTAGGSKHTVQKNDLEDGSDSTTTYNAKTNMLYDANVFRVTNDSGTDSTQIRLITAYTGITAGTAAANKAVILGSSKVLDGIGNITNAGTIGATTITGSKLVSSGTGAASVNTSGGITMSGAITGATTINCGDIDVQDTDSEAIIQLHRNEAGTNGNAVGKVKFKGTNSASEEINFAQIGGKQKTITDGSEDGEVEFNVMNGGTMQTSMAMDEDGIDIPGSRTIKFGGADAFRIMSTQNTSTAYPAGFDRSDGRIKIEIDGDEYYVAIWNA